VLYRSQIAEQQKQVEHYKKDAQQISERHATLVEELDASTSNCERSYSEKLKSVNFASKIISKNFRARTKQLFLAEHTNPASVGE